MKWLALASAGVLALGVAACGDDDSGTSANADGGGQVSGPVKIDGSSTVGPFAQAAAEQFQGENPDVQVAVGTSGTGGGFEKFCVGETDVSNASRPIKEDEEAPICKKNGVSFQEVQVANDGIAVVSNKSLAIDCLTTEQLKELWNQGSKVTNYRQLDPSLPDVEVSLYGPGTDSGTFDFFTDEINGEEGVTRKDYQPSEDDNVLVQGIQGDEGGLGYFGFSYYEQNADQLNLIGVDAGDGCVEPSLESVQDGSYEPLSRPIFMYPSEQALANKPQVKAFMEYTVDNAEAIAQAAQIVPLTTAQIDSAKQQLQEAEAKAGP